MDDKVLVFTCARKGCTKVLHGASPFCSEHQWRISMLQLGDRVKDKYKTPRPGDESLFGTVVHLEPLRIRWDSGLVVIREYTPDMAENLLERVKTQGS